MRRRLRGISLKLHFVYAISYFRIVYSTHFSAGQRKSVNATLSIDVNSLSAKRAPFARLETTLRPSSLIASVCSTSADGHAAGSPSSILTRQFPDAERICHQLPRDERVYPANNARVNEVSHCPARLSVATCVNGAR